MCMLFHTVLIIAKKIEFKFEYIKTYKYVLKI